MKKINIFMALLIGLMAMGCDKDHFAELNTDPSTIEKPDVRFSVAQTIKEMYQDDYTIWFYDNLKYVFPWAQVSAVGASNGSEFNVMGAKGGHNIYKSLLPQVRDIRDLVSKMPQDQKESYAAINALTYPTLIYAALTVTDNFGSMAFTEAGMVNYTGLLTPAYDNQEKLFNLWLSELNQAIVDLQKANQFPIGSQDVIYKGDYTKWAKFCNLLKLRIAARMINVDRAKALEIAASVGASGLYMDELGDDFLYGRGVKYYGSNNNLSSGYANQTLVDFLVQNQDPRVRFIFEKNGFNAEVVQAFIDAKKALPPYVAAFVELDDAGNFESWKGPGEPWVRYFGVPISPDETQKASNNIYFDQANLYKIKLNEVEKSYAATSVLNRKQIQTNFNFTYPTKPGGRVLEMKDNYPGLQVLMGSAAETNLYLAEFKLLGANLPKTAQEYFSKGVELSVLRMDALAKNNGNLYYDKDPVYTSEADALKGSTKLRDGEIAELLKQPAYDLSVDGLEKVYIQQYINFMTTPGDLWTTVRRSGIPKRNSAYLPYVPFLASGAELVIPRRFDITLPTADDLNFANKQAALKEQGFTAGTTNPTTLNTQRLWFDKNNPDYGNGPK